MINSFLEKIKVLCASYFLKFIYITNRKDVRGRSHYRILLNEGKSVILSAWHGQLLTITHDLANENFHAIAGTHRDAELISQYKKNPVILTIPTMFLYLLLYQCLFN